MKKMDKHAISWFSGITVAFVAYLSLVTAPQMNRIRSAMAEVESQQYQQTTAGETRAQIAALEAEVTKLSEETKGFDQRIPASEDVGAFLQDLGRFAEQRQVRPEEIQPGEPIVSEKVVALPVTFRVRGPFKSVFGLIQDIEQMPRLALIESIEAVNDDASGMVDVLLKLRVYFRSS